METARNPQLSPFYSAPLIFAVLRNLVREIWFEKSGSRKVVDQKKNPSLQNHFSRTTFIHLLLVAVFIRKTATFKVMGGLSQTKNTHKLLNEIDFYRNKLQSNEYLLIPLFQVHNVGQSGEFW